MIEEFSEFAHSHRLALAVGIPIGIFAAWLSSLLVPEVVKAVVPKVIRTLTGSEARVPSILLRIGASLPAYALTTEH